MVQLFIDGGGFMWPILFIFIIGFVFVIERLYHLIKGLSSNEEFAHEIAATVLQSGIDSAKAQCEGAVGPVAIYVYLPLIVLIVVLMRQSMHWIILEVLRWPPWKKT